MPLFYFCCFALFTGRFIIKHTGQLYPRFRTVAVVFTIVFLLGLWYSTTINDIFVVIFVVMALDYLYNKLNCLLAFLLLFLYGQSQLLFFSIGQIDECHLDNHGHIVQLLNLSFAVSVAFSISVISSSSFSFNRLKALKSLLFDNKILNKGSVRFISDGFIHLQPQQRKQVALLGSLQLDPSLLLPFFSSSLLNHLLDIVFQTDQPRLQN